MSIKHVSIVEKLLKEEIGYIVQAALLKNQKHAESNLKKKSYC